MTGTLGFSPFHLIHEIWKNKFPGRFKLSYQVFISIPKSDSGYELGMKPDTNSICNRMVFIFELDLDQACICVCISLHHFVKLFDKRVFLKYQKKSSLKAFHTSLKGKGIFCFDYFIAFVNNLYSFCCKNAFFHSIRFLPTFSFLYCETRRTSGFTEKLFYDNFSTLLHFKYPLSTLSIPNKKDKKHFFCFYNSLNNIGIVFTLNDQQQQ